MLSDPSDRWKDLLIERRAPRWPKVLVILLILGGLGYWFYAYPEQVTLIKSRFISLTQKTLQAPVVAAPVPVSRKEPEEDLLAPDPQPSQLKN